MKKTLQTLFYTITVSWGVLLSLNATAQPYQKEFKNPSMKYRPIPLWFWNNTTVESDVLLKQLDSIVMRDGYGGVAILPFGKNFKPEYLSDDYFSIYEKILIHAEKLGIQLSMYDEYGFPTGGMGSYNADGVTRFKNLYPQSTIKRLDKTEYSVDQLSKFSATLPEGLLMAIVAMDTITLERKNLREYVNGDKLEWNVPSGAWRVMFFTCVPDPDSIVDYLDPDAVKLFIKETHEAYYTRFEKYFGTTITSTFFDEPTMHRAQGRMWTPRFNEKFIEMHSNDPELLYPALWYDIGEETQSARNMMYSTRAELYSQGFQKPIQEWAATHKIYSTGHQDQEEVKNPVSVSGDLMLCGKYMDAPGIDKIGGDRPAELFYKVVSSSAYNWDKTLVMSETYGAMGNIPVSQLYHIAMDQYAKGVNVLIPHAVWYNDQNVIFLPELSCRNPLYSAALPDFNQFLSRLNVMLQNDGAHVADIAILYPIESMQGEHYLDGKLGSYKGGVEIPKTDYITVSSILSDSIGRDFTYLHPQVLDEKCSADGGLITLNNKIHKQQYKIVIVPSVRTISLKNLKKLEQFQQDGGHVIFTTQLPEKSVEQGMDAQVRQIVKKMITEQRADFVETPTTENIQKLVSSYGLLFDVEYNNSRQVSYIHKTYNGKHIYYFANLSDQAREIDVTLKGKIKPVVLNPHNGEQLELRYEHQKKQGEDVTCFTLPLQSIGSLFITE